MSPGALVVLAVVLFIFAIVLAFMNEDARIGSGEPRGRLAWALGIGSGVALVMAAVTSWPA